MTITLGFDVYGTLIDTHGVVAQLQEMIGNTAQKFSSTWREKQLEYSFRRGLMQNYQTFAICTSQALDFTCDSLKISLTQKQKQILLDCYKTLPAFDDVTEGLTKLQATDIRTYAFSNGTAVAIETLLVSAGIRDLFQGVVSVDDLKSFKPNPAVYSHFLRKSEATGKDAWLVSGNPFDVIGAMSAGMKGVWLKRSEDMIFDPWGIEPTITVNDLRMLSETIVSKSFTDSTASN